MWITHFCPQVVLKDFLEFIGYYHDIYDIKRVLTICSVQPVWLTSKDADSCLIMAYTLNYISQPHKSHIGIQKYYVLD